MITLSVWLMYIVIILMMLAGVTLITLIIGYAASMIFHLIKGDRR